MILVLRLMATGFPEGAGALRRHGTRGRWIWTGRASRYRREGSPATRSRFRVQGPDHVVEGDWGIAKAAPWPDSQPMAGWVAGNGVTIPNMTLGELRQLRRR